MTIMTKKGHNTYFYLLYKVLLAFCSLEAMQILFHAANSHIFHLESFGEWAGMLWGNLVFGLATVCMVLLPFAVLMLLPVQARWKKWYRIITEVLYVVPVLFLLVARAADSAYYLFSNHTPSTEIYIARMNEKNVNSPSTVAV